MNTLILNASNAFREFPSGAVVKNLPANTGDARDLSSIPRLGISPGVGNGCSVQFSSVQLLSRVWFFAAPCTAAHQASLSITNSWSLFKLISIKSVMPSNHLSLWRPLLRLPSIFPSIRVFSNGSVLYIRWPKYWSFSCSISPSKEQCEKEVGTHSSLLDWKIPWTEEPGGLQSMGLHLAKQLSMRAHTNVLNDRILSK